LSGLLETEKNPPYTIKPVHLVFYRTTKNRTKTLVADSQYSCRKPRDQARLSRVRAVIPYPANQRRRERRLLRVDKYFRTHGSATERRVYRRRGSIERVNSRQKEQVCLNRHRARGLKRITVHALLCVIAMLLNALAALRLNMPEKAIHSPCWQDRIEHS
jgi:hypothetical protein